MDFEAKRKAIQDEWDKVVEARNKAAKTLEACDGKLQFLRGQFSVLSEIAAGEEIPDNITNLAEATAE